MLNSLATQPQHSLHTQASRGDGSTCKQARICTPRSLGKMHTLADRDVPAGPSAQGVTND